MSATIVASRTARGSEPRTARITVLAGDGVGPEVTTEAVKVLGAVAARFGHDFRFDEGLIGGCAMDATGSSLPEATLELCRSNPDIGHHGLFGDWAFCHVRAVVHRSRERRLPVSST